MKKLITAAFTLLISFSSFAQGTLIFNNRTPAGDRPITRHDNGQGFGTVPGATAQLWLVTGALGSEVFTPLTPTTPFLTGNAAAFFMEISPFIVPGVQSGESARFTVRVWAGAPSYYEAITTQNSWIGQSVMFTVDALGVRLREVGLQFPLLLWITSNHFRLFPFLSPRPLPFAFSAVSLCWFHVSARNLFPINSMVPGQVDLKIRPS